MSSQGRHEARLWAVQFLYQVEYNKGDRREALDLFWASRKAGPKLVAFTEELVDGVISHRKEIDSLLARYAEHWDVKRMGMVDRNIMRVALYEMLHRDDIPPVVSINEAVELAKQFSGDESGRFVNGILDRARKDLKRPARAAAVVNPNLKTDPS